MIKSSFLFLSLLLILSSGFCQSLDSLSLLIKDIQRGKNDSVRFASNEKFLLSFEKLLLQKGSFSRNFDSLKNISIQTPDDKKFKIYSWVLPHYDGSVYDYFGFLQVHSENSDTLFRLVDSTSVIQKPESEKLRTNKWLGAVYYSIIPVNVAGKNYYTLLGWKAKNQAMTQKIIEVLFFAGNQPKFGYPLIKTGSVFHNRLIFSFNSQATMTLHFDKNFNGIVFDHISSNKNNESILQGPDGTFDALKFYKGKWLLKEDIDVRSKWEPSDKLPEPKEEVK